MIYALAIYAVFCLLFAKWNAVRIEQDKPIYHDQNAMLHSIWYGVAIFINLFTHEWFLMLAMPFVGRLFFDTALNGFRHKGLFYVSEDAKAAHYVAGSSKIDWLEYRIFKSGAKPKLLCLFILITIITMFYATS